MGLVVTALTVSLAVANQLLLGALRSAMRYVDLLAAAFVVLSGVYLALLLLGRRRQRRHRSITDAVQRFQSRISATLDDHWQLIAVVLAAVVAAAVVFVARRPAARSRRHPSVSEPATDASRLRPAATVMLVRDADAGGIEVFDAAARRRGGVRRRDVRVPRRAGRRRRRRGRRSPRSATASTTPRRRRRSASDAAVWRSGSPRCASASRRPALLLARPARRRAARRRRRRPRGGARGELSMVELCRRHDLVLDAGGDPLRRPLGDAGRRDGRAASTPASSSPPRRPDQEGRHDDAELVDSRWVAPGRGPRRRRDGGELMMMPPTIANLRFIAELRDRRRRRSAAPTPSDRHRGSSRRSAAGPTARSIGVVLPGDPDYDDA